MNSVYFVLASAFIIDLLLGDPYYKFHPVRLIGRWASFLENIFFRFKFTSISGGIIFWITVIFPLLAFISVLYLILIQIQSDIPVFIFQVFIVYSCIAFRDMIKHSKPVYEALNQNDLGNARLNLRKIVGRDTNNLNENEVIRACIESVSESFVDGFLSPVMAYLTGCFSGYILGLDINLFGILFIVLYRSTNTLDSMVGYKNTRYEKFGKSSARMDDLLNFFPARLSVLFILPAVIATGNNYSLALKTFISDRLKSSSPNAGHSMSLFSGALEIKLGGGAIYSGQKVSKPWIGENLKDGETSKIREAIDIFIFSGWFTVLLSGAALKFIIR